MYRSQEIFCTMTSSILSNPSFEDVRLGTLVRILEQTKLQINSEIELFSAVERWARSECIRKGLNPKDRKCLRSVVGDALTKIRFLALTPQQFADGTADSSLLLENEVLAIFMNISSKGKKLSIPVGLSANTQSWVDPQKQIPGHVIKSSANTGRSRENRIREILNNNVSGSTIVGTGSYVGQKYYCRRVENHGSHGYYSSQPAYEHLCNGDTNTMKSSITFTVDRNISIIGIEVPSQVRNSVKFKNLSHNQLYHHSNQNMNHSTRGQNVSDKYNEMLTVTLCNSNETILASTDHSAQVQTKASIEVMFNRSVNIDKDEVCSRTTWGNLYRFGHTQDCTIFDIDRDFSYGSAIRKEDLRIIIDFYYFSPVKLD